jgi:hypothetical protein
MNKAALVLIPLAAAATLCGAAPLIFVEEDFEGSQFPPEGWSVHGMGDWGWSNPGGYADGYATSTVGSTASCSIRSPWFHLEGARRVRAVFRYVATGYGSAPTDHSIYLVGGGGSGGYTLPKAAGWEDYDWTSPPAWAYDDFRISWVATVYSPYNSGTGILRLDGVVLTLYNVDVSPTSIGRVKALYR